MSQPAHTSTPNPQSFYTWVNQTWQPVLFTQRSHSHLQTLRLTTWNIDFQAPCKTERMNAALSYLSKLHGDTTTNTTNTPSMIFLQEMVSSDLVLIQEKQWIRDRFFITDLSDVNWGARYGTTTLIDKRLDVQRVFRVLYSPSRMQRDALFVDINIDIQPTESTSSNENRIIRLGNTHLESLVSRPPLRPMQLRRASEFMHGHDHGQVAQSQDSLPTPYAAVLAGDMNAFASEDLTAPEECGLSDAFLLSDRMKEKFGCSRMDKVLFCGGLEVKSLERIGAEQKIWIDYPQESDSESSSETGEEMWVTDHLGLQVEFRILPSVET
ncbi:endonuclease/exonuclease/phosphatase family protein [Aspergillus tanneri]|uniref:Endonuclease/exonuclease/phosphatase domain-containing protein n=1 Tax=Aspergillus tanneri TaxID=1220188 RepID=A0A5M9MGL3_9EURO|nr:uncharacterized protein ATNIH1004_008311 [Aspergillus tanneri]KAA8644113.1 hypothetical protein ATNIH1004_008311 [Aspergillus tanneri]